MYAGGDTHTPYIDYVVTNGATGLEIASAAVSARKILYNGRLYILVGKTLYSVTGETIRK